MCNFCENNGSTYVHSILLDDSQYGKLDSCQINMLHDGYMRVQNIDGRSWDNRHPLPIFQFDVLYCPFCGRKIKEQTTLSTEEGTTITNPKQ